MGVWYPQPLMQPFTVMTLFMTYLLFSDFPGAEQKALIPMLEIADSMSWYFNSCLFEPFTPWIHNQLEIKRWLDLLGSTAGMMCMTNALFVQVNIFLVHIHLCSPFMFILGDVLFCASGKAKLDGKGSSQIMPVIRALDICHKSDMILDGSPKGIT